ncbi:MAG TPA: hypothetical protein DC046_07865 [Rhodospirillaceae bacterium]|nr:hypothetical protein [Rhodospirillaceae bacterium]
MSADDENPLSRWARLKRKSAKGEAVEEAPVQVARRGAAGPVAGLPEAEAPETALATAPDGAAADDDDVRELTAEEAAYVETLPPLDELNPNSDFTGFMDKRVPDFLRRQALRKLWLSDPAFSLIDGMHEYGEDYSMMAQLAAGATAYRPNEGGYAWRDKPKDPEAEEATENGAVPTAEKHAETPEAEGGEGASAENADDDGEESISDKARRVQDRGGSSVRLPTYTPNPYYQSPGQRHPAPEVLPEPARAQVSQTEGDDDGLGDGEDDLA